MTMARSENQIFSEMKETFNYKANKKFTIKFDHFDFAIYQYNVCGAMVLTLLP